MASRRLTGERGSDVRAFGVVLEQIQSQLGVVAEAVTDIRASLDKKMDAEEARTRFDVIESVVRQNSADIRALDARVTALEEAVRRNTQDIQGLREEVAQLRHDFNHRRELAALSELETRVAALERRIGSRR